MRTSHFPPSKSKPMRRVHPPAVSDKLEPTVSYDLAEAAVQVLESQAFDHVYNRLRTEILAQFTSSPPHSAPLAMALSYRIQALDAVRDGVQALADQMKLHKRRRAPTEWAS